MQTGQRDRPPRSYRQGSRAEATADTHKRIITCAQERFLSAHYDEVTLDDIAAGAGVTRQTVLNHFDSKHDLFVRAVTSLPAPRHTATPADRAGIVSLLLDEYEMLGDALIRLLAVESRFPEIAEFLTATRVQHHEFLTGMFTDLLPPRGRERFVKLAEVHAALDVYVWKLLRRDLDLTLTETEQVMRGFLGTALPGWDAPPNPESRP